MNNLINGTDWTIGVDLGGTKMRILAVDRNGGVLGRETRNIRYMREYVSARDALAEAIRALTAKVRGGKPLGVGVGVAGQVDVGKGEVIFAPNLQWRNAPLGTDLQDALKLPVILENDVSAVAMGEANYGSGKGFGIVLTIFAGTGIGGGLTINGKLFAGGSHTSMEIGHVVAEPEGIECSCGKKGCVEAYSSGDGIRKRVFDALDRGERSILTEMMNGDRSSLNASMVENAAMRGDSTATKIWNDAKLYLGILTANLVTIINPDIVVLGGGVIVGCPSFLDSCNYAVNQRALPVSAKHVLIFPSKLKDRAGPLGAAALAFDKFQT